MKLFKVLLISSMALLLASSAAIARDFDWARDFNIQAQVDPSGFRARIATRFNIGDVHVKAMLDNFDSPADAYIMLRLGEISGWPTDYVVEKYRHNKNKGWGSLAKSLGIKPGSEDFHALKQGHDLYGGNSRNKTLYSSYGRDNDLHVGNDKGKGKNKGKK